MLLPTVSTVLHCALALGDVPFDEKSMRLNELRKHNGIDDEPVSLMPCSNNQNKCFFYTWPIQNKYVITSVEQINKMGFVHEFKGVAATACCCSQRVCGLICF